MAGDWRITAEERARYDSYFQQCGPVQGYLLGEQAREFFIKSNLSGDVLRKIWDLADLTADGRLDKREFAIACYLISSQVQKKGPLPSTLPASLISDLGTAVNGAPSMTTVPLLINPSSQSLQSGQPPGHILKNAGVTNISIVPITPAIRSKYLQQFHSLIDVTKTNGFMAGLQAKNILQQTGLSNTLLHQIWNLSDFDKDGRLTADEFIIAMHCCDLVRMGQQLPNHFPDEWLTTNTMQRERIDSSSKSNENQTFSQLNQQLKEQFNTQNQTENSSKEQSEAENKAMMATYEEKRLKNYEDGNRELERRRQLLREQEEHEQKEREERERKRESEIQKQKEDQERKKQIEIERQLEKQRQIEQQKEEERKKLLEQREAARKEMERKSRLEWERQRMQELSTQKSRLLEQINDLKSREKAFELELESMNDTIQTNQTKINQTETNIRSIDETIGDIQKNIVTEKNLYENIEQQKKDLKTQLNTIQAERESLDSSLFQLNQSKEFSMTNRESDQIKYIQVQIENKKEENVKIDEQITKLTGECKQCQNEMEDLRLQLEQLELEAKDKQPSNENITSMNPPVEFANFDHFNTNVSSNEIINQSSDSPVSLPVAPTSTSATPTVEIDPFQTVDPFASQPDVGATTAHNDWFQPLNNQSLTKTNDPFIPKTEPTENLPLIASPSVKKKPAPKPSSSMKDAQKQSSNVDPWGQTTTTNNSGNNWAQFDNNTSSPFNTTSEWSTTKTVTNENLSSGSIQYRALYDYVPERPDEMGILMGDIIIVDPTKQQDENWLFGQIGNDKQGYFPAAYTERLTSIPSNQSVDKTSQLSSGSWVMTLAEYQGKTQDKHLSFGKGELILVREQKDATWYSGKLHGKIGWFPRNYVRPATEVEIENNKNSAKNTPINEKPLNSFNDNLSNNVDVYETIYAYEATDPSDLSFDIGEHIIVLKRDGDWWTGQIGDRIGTFPYNYVQKIENLQETAIAIKSFETNEEGRLSFESGQLINITNKDDKEWYQGEIRVPDQAIRSGSFPADYVQIQTTIPSTTSNGNISKLPHYIAIFPYDAQQEDELSFPADAVLEILEEVNTNGWFKARLDNKIGLIPSTYVQPIDVHNQSSSTPYNMSPYTNPCTPTTANSSQHRLCDDSAIETIDDSATMITDTSSHQALNNSSRIIAIRELIETEQRYVNDLRTVANEFIKPLSNGRILNDYEIEQLFCNWFALIACNSVFLTTLEEQISYKEPASTSDTDVFIRMPRSASMSNITMIGQAPTKLTVDNRHQSFDVQVSYSSSANQLEIRDKTNHQQCSPLTVELSTKRSSSIERVDDNIVPHSFYSSSSITINNSTRIGDILCSYLPYMADAYFQYCNCRSQANKYLQSKIDLNDQFRSHLEAFQNKTGGLSLNGFLTKPIQRVTRYPLLIEKICKHTSINHPDYKSIQKAYECARQLTERINKQICDQENISHLDWLQQHVVFETDEHSTDGYLFDELLKFNSITRYQTQRKLLLHGSIMKIPSGKELLAFLFTDFLLFSTIKSSSTNWQSKLFESKSNLQLKLYRLPIFLTDIISMNETTNDQLTFSIITKTFEKPLILRTQQTNVRTLWMRTINNAIEECQTIERSIAANKASFTTTDDEQNRKFPIARLILIIEEAHDLIPSKITMKRHRAINPYCEVTVGSLTLKTPFIKRTNNPKWNTPMEFPLYNLNEDIIHINIFDNEFFSPNENIGYSSLNFIDILPCPLDTFVGEQSKSFTQTIYLNNAATVIVKCTVELL